MKRPDYLARLAPGPKPDVFFYDTQKGAAFNGGETLKIKMLELRSGAAPPLYVAASAVTWREYEVFCKDTGRALPPIPDSKRKPDEPATMITWSDSNAFCEWAGLRLPTEAEHIEAEGHPDLEKKDGIWEWCSDKVDE